MLILPETQRHLSHRILQRLALNQLVVFIPFIFVLPPVISAFTFVVPIWVYWRVYFNRSPEVTRWIVSALTIFAAVGVLAYFGTFRGKDAGVSLIVVMYSLKLLEAKKYRDLNLLLTLAFFVLSMNFLFTQSLWAVVYLFAGFLFFIQSLVIANSLTYQALPWRRGIKLLAITVPVMILLFLFFPRLPGPLWKTPNQNSATTGISDSMTPGDIGILNQSDLPAFRATFAANSVPEKSQLYWRGLVFENYDGLTWSPSRQRRRSSVELELTDDLRLDYSIILEPTARRYLFGLDFPLQVTGGLAVTTDGTLAATSDINKRIRYSVTSVPSGQLETELTPLLRAINLSIPENFNPRSLEWSREQYTNYNNPEDYVQFLLRYINREPYYYTLTPPIMLENMVDDFWFEQKRGFCEHYSGSLVFMLRAAGVPARIVTGYQGGEYNQVGNYWLIMQRDAHAWAEYWINGRGWIRVDPTSAIAASRIDASLLTEMGQRGLLFDDLPGLELFEQGWLEYSRQWFDNLNQFWHEWVLDYDMSNQLTLFRHFNLDKLPKQQLYLILSSIVIFVLSVLGWRLVTNREKLDKVGSAYRKLLNKLARKGFEKKPNEGPQDFIRRVIKQRPEWQSQLSAILRLYLQLRFAETISPEKKQNQLRQQVAQLKL